MTSGPDMEMDISIYELYTHVQCRICVVSAPDSANWTVSLELLLVAAFNWHKFHFG